MNNKQTKLNKKVKFLGRKRCSISSLQKASLLDGRRYSISNPKPLDNEHRETT